MVLATAVMPAPIAHSKVVAVKKVCSYISAEDDRSAHWVAVGPRLGFSWVSAGSQLGLAGSQLGLGLSWFLGFYILVNQDARPQSIALLVLVFCVISA